MWPFLNSRHAVLFVFASLEPCRNLLYARFRCAILWSSPSPSSPSIQRSTALNSLSSGTRSCSIAARRSSRKRRDKPIRKGRRRPCISAWRSALKKSLARHVELMRWPRGVVRRRRCRIELAYKGKPAVAVEANKGNAVPAKFCRCPHGCVERAQEDSPMCAMCDFWPCSYCCCECWGCERKLATCA